MIKILAPLLLAAGTLTGGVTAKTFTASSKVTTIR